MTADRSRLASPNTIPADTVEPDDRLLLERIRLGARCVLAGIFFVFFGELVVNAGARPWINVIQAINFAAVAALLPFLRDPSRRRTNMLLGFAGYVATVIAVGAVGIVANDAMTPVVLFVGLPVVTATLIPWSPRWQLASVALVIGTAIWTVANVVPDPPLFWLQNVGSVAPTLAFTIFLCDVLGRQRVELARAEQERANREAHLREANRRLELEIDEHRKTENALRFAMRELDHRVKNTLATLQSVADHSLRSSRSLDEFSEAFGGRIQAMARIHTALAGRKWGGLTVGELIELVVGPYRHHADSVAVECDATFIDAELVRVLGMTLHELATNAAKYGALSTKEGRVAIRSRLDGNGGRPHLRIRWSERQGPVVRAPSRRGFGLRLIEEALAYEAEGTARVQFPSEGLCCELQIPMARAGA
jgi:two-component sensor histidine kinase